MERRMLETGRVVKSIAGRDCGYLLAVLSQENNYVFVCDGKERPLENPKKKNLKHLIKTNVVLTTEDMESNRKLRKALCKNIDNLEEVK